MPYDKRKYPKDWTRISTEAKRRANYHCELCNAVHGEPHPMTGSKVVLTTHHLDFDPTNNHPYNLLVGCQRCHLRLDKYFHLKNKRHKRARRAIGQAVLL
jgi:5-methylcytosine-specific restriction endonuclease McrA